MSSLSVILLSGVLLAVSVQLCLSDLCGVLYNPYDACPVKSERCGWLKVPCDHYTSEGFLPGGVVVPLLEPVKCPVQGWRCRDNRPCLSSNKCICRTAWCKHRVNAKDKKGNPVIVLIRCPCGCNCAKNDGFKEQ